MPETGKDFNGAWERYNAAPGKANSIRYERELLLAVKAWTTRNGGWWGKQDFDDVFSYLLEKAWASMLKYNPSHASNGGRVAKPLTFLFKCLHNHMANYVKKQKALMSPKEKPEKPPKALAPEQIKKVYKKAARLKKEMRQGGEPSRALMEFLRAA